MRSLRQLLSMWPDPRMKETIRSLWRDINFLPFTAVEDTEGFTGFVDKDNIDVAYNWTDRTITLTGNLEYYWRGRKKTLVSPWVSPVHDAVAGIYFLYTTNGITFAWSQIPWSFSACMVSVVNYKSTAAMSFAICETHGTMDKDAHEGQHDTHGTYLDPANGGGKATAGTYALNTATDAANTPGFDLARLEDEDLETVVPAWIQGTYTTMYIGASLAAMFDVAANLPFIAAGSYLQVNDPLTGAMADGINNRFYNVYQVLMPVSSDSDSQKFRMIMLQPQATFSSQALAEAEEANGLNLGELNNLSPEFKIYARLTYGTLAGNANTGKCTLKSITYVAGTKANSFNVGGGVPTDHAALSNLSWVASGHSGTASKLAGFDVNGLPALYDQTSQWVTGTNGISYSTGTRVGNVGIGLAAVADNSLYVARNAAGWAGHFYNEGSATGSNGVKIFTYTYNSTALEINGTKLILTTPGNLRLGAYGAGTITGTATKNLSVDANGNVIETALSTSIWTDAGTYIYPTTYEDIYLPYTKAISWRVSAADVTGNNRMKIVGDALTPALNFQAGASDVTVFKMYSDGTAKMGSFTSGQLYMDFAYESDSYTPFTLASNSNTKYQITGMGNIIQATSSAPTTPALGFGSYYTGTDKKPHFINSDGTDYDLTTSGITSLNGLSGVTQTFGTIGTTGTAPAWTSTGTAHTLNIPMAASASVSAGLISKTQYDTFNGKQAALVSGTNIKTVGGVSLLSSGDVGTIGATYGGTGQSSYAVGDLLYASSTTALSKLASVAAGKPLLSGGVSTAPSYAAYTFSGTSAQTYTFPSATATLMSLGGAESVTGVKTFNGNALKMKGSSTGVTTFATANTSVTNYTQTLQAKDGTIALNGTQFWELYVNDAVEAFIYPSLVFPSATNTVNFKAGTGMTIAYSLVSSTPTLTFTSTGSLPLAANGTRGGVQIGYAASAGNLPVQLNVNEQMYVALTKSAIETVATDFVKGPASSVIYSIPFFSNTTGKLIEGTNTKYTSAGNLEVYAYSTTSTLLYLSTNNVANSTNITGLIVRAGGTANIATFLDYNNNAKFGFTGIGDFSAVGSVQVGTDTDAVLTVGKVGKIRYRATANNSYCEMVMQTAASTYAWVVIKTNTW